MPRRVLLTLAAALAAAPALAAVPSPANSSYPPCLVACPFGDIPFSVTVRDLANLPVAGASVVLDFSDCPGAFVCSFSFPPPPYVYDPSAHTVSMQTDAAGQVEFPLHIGGVCGAGSVRLSADGILFRSYALATPDQDGNGFVSGIILNDHPLFLGKLGTTDPTADFDCDGDVDSADQTIMIQHDCHACEGCGDAVRRTTWGRVKTIYR